MILERHHSAVLHISGSNVEGAFMIEFSNVSKVYPNGVVGLDDVNLTIEQGEVCGNHRFSGRKIDTASYDQPYA